MNKNLQFEPLYPDVLGAIAGSARFTYDDVLQVSVGIYPRSAYINQPIEVFVILQNMIDQNMEVKVALNLPSRAPDGSPIKLSTPKKEITLTMSAGEVGIMRLPLVALPPTPATIGVPVRLAIRHRNRTGKAVRASIRGAPPSALSVSPFKLQALRDVVWVDPAHDLSPEVIRLSFDVNAKRLPDSRQSLKSVYETLWTQERMRDERRNILSKIDQAHSVATSFTRMAIFDTLLRTVDDAYALHGLPLHPGETAAIAKMLMYTLGDRSEIDPHYKVEDQHWFHVLCQVLAHDDQVALWTPGEIVVTYLFESTMYDAVMLAFSLILSRIKVDLGDSAERVEYANKIMRWLSGYADPDLVFIYLPLALGGVIINHWVTWPGDDPWAVIDGLREAYRGRVRLIEGDAMEIFDILDKLLARGEDDLKRLRVPR